MYKFTLFFGSLFALFFSRCAPAIWQLTDSQTNPQLLQNAFGDKPIAPKTVENSDNSVWVDMQRNYIYAGVPNYINILNGAEPSLSLGTIKASETNIGQYIIQVDIPNVSVELSINNASKTASNIQKTTYNVLPLPMPEWRITGLQNGAMLAQDFRRLRNFELVSTAVGQKTVLINCSCLSFNLIRIDNKNQRSQANNNGTTFGTATVALLNQATTGDIFIIQQLKTQCSAQDKTRIMPSLAIEII